MSWWGKVIGGAFGFLLGGPLGALLGAAVGHGFDRGLRIQDALESGSETEQVQTAFFTATFSVMGHIAKADGRVSEDEIRAAQALMAHMRLDEHQRQVAIQLFHSGKAPDFPLDAVLDQYLSVCGRRRNVMRMFLEILVGAAMADGVLHDAERQVMEHVRARLGFRADELEQIIVMASAASHFRGRARSTPPPRGNLLAEAYEVLGVDPSADDADVKRAYRRLMSQHHPDKLVSRGLPEEMMQIAKEKTQEIKAAYETIRTARTGR